MVAGFIGWNGNGMLVFAADHSIVALLAGSFEWLSLPVVVVKGTGLVPAVGKPVV